MIEKEITVANALGIHARPASKIVQTAVGFSSDIELIKDDVHADAKSIMSVMMLAAACHSRVVVRAQGSDEEEAVEAIVTLFGSRFSEE